MYTRYNPNLLLLICSCNMSTSHLLAPQPARSANVHCQAGRGSSWQMRPVSTLSADGLKFCVSILFSCAWWTHRVGHRVCVPFVSTRQTPHVCLGSPLSLPPCATANITVSPPTSVSVSTFHLLELLFGNASNRGLIEHKVQKLEMIEQMCVRSKVV